MSLNKKIVTFSSAKSELEERIYFLPSSSSSLESLDSQTSNPKFWRLKKNLIIHGILILLYTTLSITIILSFHRPAHESQEEPQAALPSLKVQYLTTTFRLMRDSPYIGHPENPEIDNAWSTLFQNMSLRVSDAELKAQTPARTSISLPRGGNLAWLGVFHELHCIKVMRKANYREFYNLGIKAQELRDFQVHVDHCIELLRASAMCRPDLETLTTFSWREGMRKPMLSAERPQRRCVDWTALMDGLEDRVVGREEVGKLKNPGLEMGGTRPMGYKD